MYLLNRKRDVRAEATSIMAKLSKMIEYELKYCDEFTFVCIRAESEVNILKCMQLVSVNDC